MANSKASTRLATTQTLTASYAATNTVASMLISDESSLSLEITYTTGAAEVGSALNYIVELSYDNSTWVQETQSSLASNVDTQTNLTHKISGGAGATAYNAHYYLPLVSRYVRVRVKETGVGGNYGTVSITATTASGSGMIRNVSPAGASVATQDVNLTQVGGAAVTLGQKTMANSIPVVISSDQTIVATAAKQDTGNTSLGTIAGAVSGTEMQVDVVASLPAGTNAIGKLAANSGVDIGDVDVTSLPRSEQGPGQPGTAIDSYQSVAINLAAGADQVLVSSAPNKQIWVYGLAFTVNVAGTVSFQDEDNTALTGVMQIAATGGMSISPSGNFSMPLWKLGTDKDLEVDVVTSELDGFLTYALISV